MSMRVLCVVFVLLLCGCASDDYAKYVASQEAMQTARSNAEIAKFKAMSDIAAKGDTTVQVAAMMAMLGLTNNTSNQIVNMTPPKSGWDTAREWMSIILPVAVQGYAISANARVAVNAANNSRDVAVSTNNAFVGMASKIQVPAANVATTITKTTDNHSVDSHSVDTHAVDSHAVDTHAVDTHAVTTNTTKTTNTTTDTTTSTATDSYNTATATDSYNPNNSNQGNPVNNTNNSNQGNPVDNSNQGNPVTNPQVSAKP